MTVPGQNDLRDLDRRVDAHPFLGATIKSFPARATTQHIDRTGDTNFAKPGSDGGPPARRGYLPTDWANKRVASLVDRQACRDDRGLPLGSCGVQFSGDDADQRATIVRRRVVNLPPRPA